MKATCLLGSSNRASEKTSGTALKRLFATITTAVLVAGGAVTLAPAAVAGQVPLSGQGPVRMSGADRYSTAQAISRRTYSSPTPAVYLATGTQFADALSAGPAAAKSLSPVLLTAPRGLPTATASELQRLRPQTIFIMGGQGAVSDSVVTAARRYSPRVIRLMGADRYSTAVRTSQYFWASSNTVYVASGATFADALSGGALAAKNKSPILLTAPGSLPQVTRAELQRLRPSKIVVLGGPGAVSAAVVSQIASAVPGASVPRIQGADRYATSAAVAQAGWGSAAKAIYAVGTNFPDALAGVPLAATNGGPLLLTSGSCMPTSVWAQSRRLGVQTQGVLGGQGVLSITAVSASCGEAAPFPAPSATARSYQGSRDSVVNISKPDGAASKALATITYRGNEYFSVVAFDRNNNQTDLLANEVGSYVGTALLDAYSWAGTSAKVQVTADGPWTLSIASVRAAPSYGKGTIRGKGNAVFNYTGSSGTARISNSGSGYFGITAFGKSGYSDLIVNDIGPYTGTRVWTGGPAVYSVEAEGLWSAVVR